MFLGLDGHLISTTVSAEIMGIHGVPDPLVILWGLLNAGLNRGLGGPRFFYHETLRAS